MQSARRDDHHHHEGSDRLASAVAWGRAPNIGQDARGDAGYGSQSFNAVNQLLVLGRWMRMITISNQSSAARAYEQFDAEGRMLPSAYYDRIVDVMEELRSHHRTLVNERRSPAHLHRGWLQLHRLTGRLHFDVGGYNYRPNSAATRPQDLQDGVNARARIGIVAYPHATGEYALIADVGGSQDGTGVLNNAFVSRASTSAT